MKAYINYPQPHFTVHHDPMCQEPQKHHKDIQRTATITRDNLLTVLSDFAKGEYRFAANRERNDMLLDISLSSPKHEESLVYIIQELLSQRYSPFGDAPVNVHC